MREPGAVHIGMAPENRRQMFVKLCWMTLWMVYLAYPVTNLTSGVHSSAATAVGWILLAVFLGCYGVLVLHRQALGQAARWNPGAGVALATMLVISVVSCFTLGDSWLALYSYTAVSAGVILPSRFAIYGVGLIAALVVGTGELLHTDRAALIPITISAFLGGAGMTGLQRLVRTMQELREARQAVAALAASDERLRMARDLHDLLGHSLSLITLKTELTSRFLDQERYQEARAQVADIEKVSRQSLVDVREAIGGYRRPKLAVEIAAARTALTAADIEVDTDPAIADKQPGLGPDEEGALGWALREAVTNVVRHSGAKHCTVRLAEFMENDGSRSLRLEVADDGVGARHAGHGRGHGNGLTGLAERLEIAEGRLEAGPGERGRGFRVRASVPLRAPVVRADDSVAGTVLP
ncbi:two-component system sensor histidine kinase DesK [Streptacidiphilus sp. MAP12-16]|uniref:sensor histidine kinase n=1 Tax=Streptacidiphilus sp. MAP12-16 TaxID=3156300 RepID=UPI003511CAF9